MRCHKHLSDNSSDVGVCGSCLRQRLLFAIDAQTHTQAQRRILTPAPQDPWSSSHNLPDKQLPPPKVFPRSVSPYVSRRKSDATRDADLSDEIRQRFFRTPQVAPSVNKKKGKFHAISNLFRSRSTKSAQSILNPSSISVSDSGQNCRGMSPVSRDDDYKRSPITGHGSGRRGQGRPGRSHRASGMGICLSPLLRPSPSPSRHLKGAREAAYSGETRTKVNPNLSTAASMRANRRAL